MSFGSQIKNEVSKLEITKAESISELSAIIRNNAIMSDEIKIYTENSSIARRIFRLIKDIYNINSDIIILEKKVLNKKHVYLIYIREKVKEILMDLAIVNEENNIIDVPKEYILSDEEQISAYLRGIFLSGGSINDPKTSQYHLELLINNKTHALYINNLLNNYNLNSKMIGRKKGYIVYIKEAEKISDFLRYIKAFNAVMYFEDIRIYRDHKNMTNRLNNCEQATIEKIIATAKKQIININNIKNQVGLDILDEKLKETCEYRLKYPEVSLKELSEIISLETDKKVTKSGLNHRFRKIRELSNKIKE
ncbi:MAG: DNA-binding protein WhiA [Bacilli bacterium]